MNVLRKKTWRIVLVLLLVMLLTGFVSAAQAASRGMKINVFFEDDHDNLFSMRPSSVGFKLLQNGEQYQTVYAYKSYDYTGETSIPIYSDETGEMYDYTLLPSSIPDGYTVKSIEFDATLPGWNATLAWSDRLDYSANITLKNYDVLPKDIELAPEDISLVVKRSSTWSKPFGAPDVLENQGNGTWKATWKDVPVADNTIDGDPNQWTSGDKVFSYEITINNKELYPYYMSSANGSLTDYHSLSDKFFSFSQRNLINKSYSIYFDNQLNQYSSYSAGEYDQFPDLSQFSFWLVDKDGNEVDGTRKAMEVGKPSYGHAYAGYSLTLCYYDADGKYAGGNGYTVMTDFDSSVLPPYWHQVKTSYNQSYAVGYYQYNWPDEYHRNWVEWDDHDNELKLRPSKFQIRHRLADGYEDKPGAELIFPREWTWDNGDDRYSDYGYYPLYDLEGNELRYTVEADLPGYYVVEVIDTKFTREDGTDLSGERDAAFHTSKLKVSLPTQQVTASVQFENELEDGKNRPQSVLMHIKYADGSEVPFAKLAPVLVSAANNWTVTWNAPLYDENGEEAEYIVEMETFLPQHAQPEHSPVITTGTDAETGEKTKDYVFTFVEQENWNYAIDLIWDESDPTQWYEQYEISRANNKDRVYKYKLTIRVNAAQYDTGKLEVRLPYYLVGVYSDRKTDNRDEYYAPLQVGVPMADSYNPDNPFNYYIDDHGTATKADDEIVFKNWCPITDSINQTIEVQYAVSPSEMRDTIPAVFQATGKGIATYQSGTEMVEGDAEYKQSAQITCGIDSGLTSSISGYARVVTGTSWYGYTDFDHDNYMYVQYNLGTEISYSQFCNDGFSVEVPEGAEVLHYYSYGNYGSYRPVEGQEDAWWYNNMRVPNVNYDNTTTSDSMQILVRYPRTNKGAEDESYRLSIKVNHDSIARNEHVDDKVEGVDFYDVDHDELELSCTWQAYTTSTPTGNIYSFSKDGDGMPSYGVEYFDAGTDITSARFNIDTSVRGDLLNKPYQIVLEDDAMFARMQYQDGTYSDWVMLTADDYFFHGGKVYVYWNMAKYVNGNPIYLNKPKGEFLVQAQTEYGGQWTTIYTFNLDRFDETTNYVSFDVDEALFEGKNYTGMRVVSPEGMEGYISIDLYVYPTYRADSPLFQSYLLEDPKIIEFDNYSAHYINVYDEASNSYKWYNPCFIPYNGNAGFNGLNQMDLDRLGKYVVRCNEMLNTGRITHSSSIVKTLKSTQNDTVNSKVDVTFSVSVYEAHRYGDKIPGYLESRTWEEGVFYDLLPPGYRFNENKGVKVHGGSTVDKRLASLVKVETVDNYKGSGRQLVRFYVQYDGVPNTNYAYQTTNSYGPGFTIEYTAFISWTEWSYAPSGYNLVAFQEGHGEKGQPIYNAYDDDGTYFDKQSYGQNIHEVMADLNGDGLTDGKNTLCSSLYFSVDVVGAYATGVNKLVKANSGYYRMHDVADLSGPYSYKINFTASDGGTTRDLVLFDILEEAANTGTTNGVANQGEIWWEGTLTGVDASLPTRQGIAPRVYYTTSPSLTYTGIHTILNDQKVPVRDYLNDTTVWTEWTQDAPPADLSAVTALAFDLTTDTEGNPYVFEGSSATYVEIFMQAPAVLPVAELAYNRPSYYTTFTTGAQHSEGTSTHNINDRVTVELRDLKDFSFTKLGQFEQEDGTLAYEPLSGVQFDLHQCSHVCSLTCEEEGCTHTHDAAIGSSSCWGAQPMRTVYSFADGTVAFNKLSTGSYLFYEKATRTGVVLPTNTYWVIDVVATAQGGVSAPVNFGTADPHLSITTDANGNYILQNDRLVKRLQVRKYWSGEGSLQKTYRPAKLVFDVYRNGELYIEGLEYDLTSSSSGSILFTLDDLLAYDDMGRSYAYTVEERKVPGYTSAITYTTVNDTLRRADVTNTLQGILKISKTVVNGDQDKQFTFLIDVRVSGEPITDELSTKTTDASGNVTEATITPNSDGLYTVQARHGETVTVLDLPIGATYTVTEQAEAGYTSAVTSGSATGTIAQNTEHAVTYTNTYEATGEITLEGVKTVNGETPREDQVFQFQLLANQQVLKTAENAGESFAFEAITYTTADLAGSPYTYTVKESSTSGSGYTVDDTVYTVFVWLADNGDGTLEVTSKIRKAGAEVDAITFDNVYEATGSYGLQASKTVNGVAARADQQYSFSLTSTGDAPQVQQVKTNEGGTITFDPLAFTLADAGKTYTYLVKETTASQGDLVVDSREYTLSLSIADSQDGTLAITPEFLQGTTAVEAITFDNTLYTTLTIAKSVEGPETEETFPFTIQLYEKDGTETQRTFTYSGSQSGTLASGDVIRLGHGEQIVIAQLPIGMGYKVTEEPGVRYTAKVNDVEGQLAEGECAEGSNTLTFTNVLKTTSISVTKEWQGAVAGAIELTLYVNGAKADPQPVYHQDGQTYSYINLPLYDMQNQRYVYSVKEKYMDGYVTIYKNVAPYQSETESVYDGGTIINREVVSFRIRKIWEGVGNAETPDIELVLLCNGKQYRKATPEPDAKGNYVYNNLPKYMNGELAVYTVMEKPMKGFETFYVGPDGQLTNVGVEGGQIHNIKIPDTSDHGKPGWWALLSLLAVAGLGLLLLQKRWRKQQ